MVSKHRQLFWFFVICMVPFQFLEAQTQVISLKDALETRLGITIDSVIEEGQAVTQMIQGLDLRHEFKSDDKTG